VGRPAVAAYTKMGIGSQIGQQPPPREFGVGLRTQFQEKERRTFQPEIKKKAGQAFANVFVLVTREWEKGTPNPDSTSRRSECENGGGDGTPQEGSGSAGRFKGTKSQQEADKGGGRVAGSCQKEGRGPRCRWGVCPASGIGRTGKSATKK